MSTLHNLCEKWSGEGLYECQRRQVGSEVTFVVTVGQDRTLVDPYGKHAGAYILAATIKAVAARDGWRLELVQQSRTAYAASVTVIDPYPQVERRYREASGYPHIAALAAYLAALEAEAGQ